MLLALTVLCGACGESDGPGNVEPRLCVDAPTAITRTTAVMHGRVIKAPYADMPTSRFVCRVLWAQT